MTPLKEPAQIPLPRRRFVVSTACLAGLGLVGCQVNLPGSGEAPRRIRLAALEDFPPELPSAGWALQVNEPTATLSLNTARIAIGTRDNIRYVSGGQWASRAPEMVMELLAKSFSNSGRLSKVGDRRSRIRPDFVLNSQLIEFHIRTTDPDAQQGTIRVRLDTSLMKPPGRQPLATASFDSAYELESVSLDNIVTGFDASLAGVMTEVMAWTLETANKA